MLTRAAPAALGRRPLRARQARLSLVVFLAGVASLGAEVSGARLLAPYFGTSNVVWANVIGMTLLYLSIGYWLGGKVADRRPDERSLGLVVMVAAVAVALLPFASRPVFDLATDAFADLSAGALVASFVAAMLMFAIPITCLGAVAPWAIRLAVRDVSEAGAVAGRLYALSTIGSILGTFVPVLVLIPAIGTRRTLLVSAALLGVAGALLIGRRGAVLVPLGAVALLGLPAGQIKDSRGDRVLFEDESAYQFVQVVEQPDGDRVLHLNEGWGVHSILPARRTLTRGYWDAFLVLPLLTDRPSGRLVVLGNAGGTVSNLYQAAWPSTRIDGVEIDPVVSDVGRRFLGTANPNTTVHTADARFWLRRSDGAFDAVVIDAFRQPYVPFHLATREFFELVRSRLVDGGVVAANIATPPNQTEIVDRIASTARAVFPAVLVSRYDEFNSILVAFDDAATAAAAHERLRRATGLPARPAQLLLDGPLLDVRPGGEVLTDDLAPVEQLTDLALLAYLRQGAPGA